MILIFLFVACGKEKEKETPRNTSPDEGSKHKMESCPHELMQVRILPHPPNFLKMKDVQYCFYKREKNKYSFYRTLFPGEKPLTIVDKDSIVW